MKKRTRNMFTKRISIEELAYEEENNKNKQQTRKEKQQEFKDEIKVDGSSKFDKRMENYFREREAQEAEQKRKLEYLKVIDQLSSKNQGYER